MTGRHRTAGRAQGPDIFATRHDATGIGTAGRPGTDEQIGRQTARPPCMGDPA